MSHSKSRPAGRCLLSLFAGLCLSVAACGGTGGADNNNTSNANQNGNVNDNANVNVNDNVNDNGNANTNTNSNTNNNSDPPVIDQNCPDGQYSETLPTPGANLSSPFNNYSPSGYMAFIQAVLTARYPIGWQIVDGGITNYTQIHCVDFFLTSSDKASADGVMDMMSTIVHECGHMYDIGTSPMGGDNYIIRPSDLSFSCMDGDTVDRYGMTFARSLIKNDEFSSLRAPCNGGSGGCDHYADVYLDGDPYNGTFEGGDQGFNSLLEETVQYVNSLATGYAFEDQYQWTVSERDGILTFMWYLGRYLRLARNDYPSAYAHLINDACWREAILTAWGRGWLYLDLTAASTNLGLEDDLIEPLVLDLRILEEIHLVRIAHGCAS